MEDLIQKNILLFVLFLVVCLTFYIVQGIFLNKLNHLMYKKGTPMAFIPIFNIYLLGKLTIHKAVGYLLVFLLLLTSSATVTIDGEESTYTLLPETANQMVTILYMITVFGLFVYMIIKYQQLKKKNSEEIEVLDL